MSSEVVKSLVEQMSGVINRYLDPKLDLDHLSADEINANIMYLQGIQNNHGSNDDLTVAMGLISQIISHLYVARGYATSDIPRDLAFYNNIGSVKSLLRQIKNMGSGFSIFGLFNF